MLMVDEDNQLSRKLASIYTRGSADFEAPAEIVAVTKLIGLV
jgi:hypothetical protein